MEINGSANNSVDFTHMASESVEETQSSPRIDTERAPPARRLIYPAVATELRWLIFKNHSVDDLRALRQTSKQLNSLVMDDARSRVRLAVKALIKLPAEPEIEVQHFTEPRGHMGLLPKNQMRSADIKRKYISDLRAHAGMLTEEEFKLFVSEGLTPSDGRYDKAYLLGHLLAGMTAKDAEQLAIQLDNLGGPDSANSPHTRRVQQEALAAILCHLGTPKDMKVYQPFIERLQSGMYGIGGLASLARGLSEQSVDTPEEARKAMWAALESRSGPEKQLFDELIRRASEEGYDDVVTKSIALGGNLHDINWEGKTAIMKASEYGQANVVRILLCNGADASAPSDYGWTPTMFAAKAGSVDVLRLLREHGADIKAQPTRTKLTALTIAAEYGHSEALKLLLDAGCDIHSRSDMERTPLHFACAEGNLDAARILLERGADMSAIDSHGESPLHLAVTNAQNDILRLLIAHKADVNGGSRCMSPLAEAASVGSHEAIEILLEAGADVNAKNSFVPALMYAVAYGHTGNILTLLRAGADPQAITEGYTLEAFAEKIGKKKAYEDAIKKFRSEPN